MDRRNFLASIPALSAIPFIGKYIQRTESGILIVQPEQVDQYTGIDIKGWQHIECRLYQYGKHIGDARINNITVDCPLAGPTQAFIEAELLYPTIQSMKI